ncbi:hypothetical protein M2351_003628 [Azospirillum canadense]|nr:hypothetical protein [Azospirillum canadense]MCW2238998.1 hypothetical protein [Azospirillum canadense]
MADPAASPSARRRSPTFTTRFMELLAWLGATPRLDGRPNEVPNLVPFAEDRIERP